MSLSSRLSTYGQYGWSFTVNRASVALMAMSPGEQCVCVIQRDLVALVLLLAGGRLAMVEAGGGRRGKFNIVSSKWGDGWRGGDWLCEFYTNRNGQYAFWTKCTYTTLSGDLPDCFERVAPRTLRSLSSSGWSFLSFRDTQETQLWRTSDL